MESENNTHLPQSEGARSKEMNKHHNEQSPAKGVHLGILLTDIKVKE